MAQAARERPPGGSRSRATAIQPESPQKRITNDPRSRNHSNSLNNDENPLKTRPLTMPKDLLEAHHALDRAVDKCYRSEKFNSERERVEYLFKLYEALTAPLAPVDAPKRKRGRKGGAGLGKKGSA